MSKFKDFFKRYFALFILVLTISFIFIYYITVTIEKKSSEQEERGFRILSSISFNLANKQTSINKTLTTYSEKQCFSDSINQNISEITSASGENLFSLNEQFKIVKIDETWNFAYQKEIHDSHARQVYLIKVKDFVDPIINFRDDFFDNYILLYNDTIIYQTELLAYSATFNKAKDTINWKSYLNGNFWKEANLAGKDYYVFFHPVQSSSELSNITICGIISKDKFQEHTYTPDNFSFLKTILVILFLTLLLPFLKLAIMSKYERLTKTDLYLILICIAVMSVLMALPLVAGMDLILKGHKEQQDIRNIASATLKDLNRKIRTNFNNDINQTVRSLIKLEDELDKEVLEEIVALDPGACFPNAGKAEDSVVCRAANSSLTRLFQTSVLNYGYLLFILGDGTINHVWANGESLEKMKRLSRIHMKKVSQRGYYYNLKSPAGFYCYDKNNCREKFSFEPVYSSSQLEFSVFLAKEADERLRRRYKPYACGDNDLMALAVEAKLFSVMYQTLPDDVLFCVIDNGGTVLFHSDGNRNLRENFLQETDGGREIFRSCIRNRTDTLLNIKYYGTDFYAYLAPIPDYPYHVVTLLNTTQIHDSRFNIILFALANTFFIVFAISISFVSGSILSPRVSILSNNRFAFEWMKGAFKDPGLMKEIIVLLSLQSVAYIFLIAFAKGDQLYSSGLLMPLIVVAVCSIVIYRRAYVKAESYHKDEMTKEIILLGIIFFLFALFLSSSMYYYFKINILSILFLSLLVVVIYFFIRSRNFFVRFFHKPVPAFSGTISRYFSIMSLLLLINLLIFPLIVFFLTGAELESKQGIKEDLLEQAQKYEARYRELLNAKVSAVTKKILLDSFRLNGRNHYWDIFDLKDRNYGCKDRGKDKAATAFAEFYVRFVSRPKFNRYGTVFRSAGLLSDKSSDDKWCWEELPDGHIGLNYNFYDKLNYSEKNIAVSSSSCPYFKVPFHNLLLLTEILLVIIIVLIILFFLIKYAYEKFTLIGFLEIFRIASKDLAVSISDLKLNNCENLLYISLPGSGLVHRLENYYCSKGYELAGGDQGENGNMTRTLTVIKLHNPAQVPGEIIIVKDCDLREESFETLKQKLHELHLLVGKKTSEIKIIWIMNEDPFGHLDRIRKFKFHIEGNGSEESKQRESHIHYTLLKILDNFYKVYYPLRDETEFEGCHKSTGCIAEAPPEPACRRWFRQLFSGRSENVNPAPPIETPAGGKSILLNLEDLTYFQKVMDNEFNHGLFLMNLKSWKLNEEKELDRLYRKNEEELLLEIQDIAKNYYCSIWKVLSKEERFVLYDFATDGITNYKNFSILKVLISKGLIIVNEQEMRIRIMNKSFRNYVLTVINTSDAMALEHDVKPKGTWEIARVIIIVFFLLSGIVLSVTQNSLITKVLGVLTSLTSLLPVIMTIFKNVPGRQD